jgi:hypothetical protein
VTQLEQLAQAERMLAGIATATDAVEVIAFAEAARVWAQQAKLGTSAVNHATVIKLRAERRMADAVDEGQAAGQIATPRDGGRPPKKPSPSEGIKPTLADIGITNPGRLAEARKIRDTYTDEDLVELQREADELDEVLSRKDLLAGRSHYEQRRSQLSSEWYTPAIYIEAARTVLGGIDLDPASCSEANETVRAARFYDEAEGGLAQEWKGRVWLNPPYQGQAGAFITRLADAYESGDVTAGIGLITALTTDTRWFRQLWDHTLCFTYGRIQFGGEGGSSNTAGSVFIYFGPEPGRFQDEFEQFGAVVERRRR